MLAQTESAPSSEPSSAAEPQDLARLDLTEGECRALLQRELESLSARPDAPASAAIRQQRAALQSEAARGAYVADCRRRVSRGFYQCRMAAESLEQMLACARRGLDPAVAVAPENPSTQPAPGPSTTGAPVTASACQQAYEHMLKIALSSAQFARREDAAELRQRWESRAARDTFQRRCQARFQIGDLRCILESEDPDVIQACLLVIPGE